MGLEIWSLALHEVRFYNGENTGRRMYITSVHSSIRMQFFSK